MIWSSDILGIVNILKSQVQQTHIIKDFVFFEYEI